MFSEYVRLGEGHKWCGVWVFSSSSKVNVVGKVRCNYLCEEVA